jgi:RNA polymerase sigma-70 factor (ECF subfamily)
MRRRSHVSVDLGPRARDRSRIDLTALSDAVLVARVRDGDGASLDVLVARHEPLVVRLAAARLRDPEDAEDAKQEALARLVAGVRSYRGEAAFTTWLHRLVLNACEDHARRLARRRRSEVPDTPAVDADGAAGPGAAAVDEAGVSAASLPALRASLATLSVGQRNAIVLKDVLELRYEDVADVMALPVGTVKCHAHRGRKLLAERLGRTA